MTAFEPFTAYLEINFPSIGFDYNFSHFGFRRLERIALGGEDAFKLQVRLLGCLLTLALLVCWQGLCSQVGAQFC